MRFTAVFAAVLLAAVFSVSGTRHAAAITNDNSEFVENVLLASTEPSLLEPGLELASATTVNEPAAETATAEEPQAETPKKVYVTVEKGDSLTKIAKQYETTWVRIYDANKSIEDPNIINPGQKLRIPNKDEKLASRELPKVTVAVSTTSTASTSRTTSQTATSYPVSSNAAKAFIYARESGNNPNATNPNGCYGIGQDCNGVLRTMCGADYACQDAYFTRYAMARYGSWEAAYAFWQANHWW